MGENKLLLDAAEWLAKCDDDYDIFGGYPNSVYFLADYIIVLLPGNESPKYANLKAYKKCDAIIAYRKWQEMDPVDKEEYDFVSKFLSEVGCCDVHMDRIERSV
jgi:hypothetical protein